LTNITYGEICIKYLSNKYECNKKYLPSKEIITNNVFQLSKELGRTPLCIETNYSADVYLRIFGKNYNTYLESIGLIPSYPTPQMKTDEQLLEEFLMFFNKNKRIPLILEMNAKNNLSAIYIYKNRFGSINNVCNLLSIDYNTYSTKSDSIGKVCFDEIGNLCKSYEEKIISNFLIENELYVSKSPRYKELIKDDNRYFDWKIKYKNNIYYVEYFGMYYRNKNSDIVNRYKNKADKKINDLTDTNNIHKCIFIYPEDLYSGIDKYFEKLFNQKFQPSDNFKEYRPYLEYSNYELLKSILVYSKDQNFLPTWKTLVGNGQRLLYNEILNRFDSYLEFAKVMGKNVLSRRSNTWTNDTELFNIFTYMINTYGRILNPKEYVKYNDFRLKGYISAFSKANDSFVNRKLKFLYLYVQENHISDKDIEWLHKITKNNGTGIKNKINNNQIKLAKIIVDLNNNIIS
jgi:hypothetical protein